jgi:hypothetical protein
MGHDPRIQLNTSDVKARRTAEMAATFLMNFIGKKPSKDTQT